MCNMFKRHNFDEHERCKRCHQAKRKPERVTPNSHARRRAKLALGANHGLVSHRELKYRLWLVMRETARMLGES